MKRAANLSPRRQFRSFVPPLLKHQQLVQEGRRRRQTFLQPLLPDQKSISPMPAPAPGMGGAFFFGASATMASVVIRRLATEAASSNAERTTFVGSMMPLETRLPYSPVWASNPKA